MFKQAHGPRRRSIALLTLMALAATAPASIAAVSATPAPLAATGCEEHEIWADGDPAAVAARLPDRFTASDATGRPLIFARAERCHRLGAGGRSTPFTVADYGIVV